MEIYITTCQIASQWDLLYDSENSNRGPVSN